ncbi:MAG: glycosyl transferase family 39, partial [Verrucomicrobiales bacterium]|nr:glycosyl transferase family 39 [Verrucomicrobiales bacterium]
MFPSAPHRENEPTKEALSIVNVEQSSSFPQIRRVMSVAQNKNARSFIVLALGLLFLLFWGLGYRGLNDPDEGRYANIALNFLKPGADLWEPRMSGYAHYDKPPLIYWTTAFSFKVFGHNETAARLPSVFGAVLALIGLGWTATRLYGKEVAWWAIFICGTFGQFWLLARFLTPDMLLTGWCTLAIGAWAESRHRKGDWRFWLLSLLFWTLAWWTKATPALIPLLGLTFAVLLARDSAGKNALHPLFLLVGIVVLGSIWYVRMIHQQGELVDFFFIREMKGRITGHIEGRKGPIYYYAALCFVAWLPWWPMVIRAVIAKWKANQLKQTDLRSALGIEGWIVIVGTLVFSCISSKLPAYTLPLAPWAALFFARCILKLKQLIPQKNFNRWAAVSTGAIVVIYISAALVLPKFESRLRFNSSMRETAEVLKQKQGEVVYMDRYWPGMEFYWSPKTFYVVQDDYLFTAKF